MPPQNTEGENVLPFSPSSSCFELHVLWPRMHWPSIFKMKDSFHSLFSWRGKNVYSSSILHCYTKWLLISPPHNKIHQRILTNTFGLRLVEMLQAMHEIPF
jgi:hypothetical protein